MDFVHHLVAVPMEGQHLHCFKALSLIKPLKIC